MKKKYLVCFVELFGLYQYHVLLNDNYQGEEIYHPYIQKINQFEFDPDCTISSQKDILILAKDLNVNIKDAKCETLKDWGDFFRKKAQKTRSFQEPFQMLIPSFQLNMLHCKSNIVFIKPFGQ